MENVADTLRTTKRPYGKIAGLIGAGVLVVAVGLTGGSAWAARSANTADAPRAVTIAQIVVNVPMTLSPSSVEGSAVVDAAQAAAVRAAADAAARAAADAAQAKANQPSSDGGLPAGAVVPSIPGTTSPDTTKCASGTASNNSSGVAICD